MTSPTVLPSLAGGALIGLSASILLMLTGRIAGISGIVSGWLASERRSGEDSWRLAFVIGLLAGGVVLFVVRPSSFETTTMHPLLIAVAGLLVGIGTTVGNGCTSGHGVCGISRFSKRSIVGTGIFMLTAMIVTFVVRHVVGGS